MNKDSFLLLDSITAGYEIGRERGRHVVFRDFSLSISRGEILAILGPSGVGKSTILNIIAGLLVPSAGDVLLEDRSISGKRGNSSYMFQEDRLLPWRKIIDNVLLASEVTGQKNNGNSHAKQLLHRFGLGSFCDHYPSQLSGGMRRRAALARTFFLKHNLMLLDEPFSALDFDLTVQLEDEVFSEVCSEERTAIIVTHNPETATAMADRIIQLGLKDIRTDGAFPVATAKNEHNCGLAKKYGSTRMARKSPEFFELVNNLMGTFEDRGQGLL